MRSSDQSGKAVLKVKVLADPDNVAHLISGSFPTWSLLTPEPEKVTARGTVTGNGTLQVFPLEETVPPVMVPLEVMVYLRWGWQRLL